MPLSLAFAAIDTVIENAEKRGVKYFSVGFHGGGEPTADWATFKAVVERATRRAAETRTRVHLSMSTGAAFSPQKAKWIAERFTNVSISLDGPPRIQDRNRPLKSGAPSSPFVRRSLEIFDKMDFGYAIQSTVVADQVEEMPETIRWFAANTRAKTVKFEPVSDAGSFSGEKKLVPTASAFARNFIAACEIGKRLGLTVNFSGVRLQGGPVAAFCGAFTEPFSVTPEGEVSACFEAFENKGPYSDLFIFGKWDERTGKFTFDLEKLEVLRGRNIYNLTSCRNCFCKYSCGGDCATRNCRSPRNGKFSAADLLITGARCETIREITRHSLIGILKAAPRGQSTAKIPIEKKGGDVLGEF